MKRPLQSEMLRALALSAACAVSACAASYVANPHDPVDMAAELGDRGAGYVGLGAVCDDQGEGAWRRAMVEAVAREQDRLGVLAGLLSRAYRGQASDALRAHMASEMMRSGLSAAEFCSAAVRQAQADLRRGADHVLALSVPPITMGQARERGYIE